jgi:NADH-quinone oxidoreductase subunit A
LAAAPAGFNLADITRFNGIEELEVDPTGKIPAQLSGAMNQNPNNNAIK